MPDSEREAQDLRRDVIEARNQAIKTDNQVKNLALDIRAFEQRFAVLERRTRLASLGTNVIIAAVVILAAVAVHTARVKSLSHAVETLRDTAQSAQSEAQREVVTLRGRLAEVEAQGRALQEQEALVTQILEHVDAKRDKQAAELIDKVDVELLTPLARALAQKRLQELRRRTAEAWYRNGRQLLSEGKPERAMVELRRSLKLEPQGLFAAPARYWLANSLWTAKRFDEAVPVLRDMQKLNADKAPAEEVRFLLATSLARTGERTEALKLLREAVSAGGRYTSSAKAYLAALEQSADLPPLPGERKGAAAGEPANGAQPITQKNP